MQCPQCQQELTQVGNFWICPEHGPVENPLQAASSPEPERKRVADSPLKIFLSYGHDQHAVDAERIKADLEQRGHSVWFDQERLKVGGDWEQYIEEGLRECDKVVLLMTPYSVRRRKRGDAESRRGVLVRATQAAGRSAPRRRCGVRRTSLPDDADRSARALQLRGRSVLEG